MYFSLVRLDIDHLDSQIALFENEILTRVNLLKSQINKAAKSVAQDLADIPEDIIK
jgi:hypothetical protein